MVHFASQEISKGLYPYLTSLQPARHPVIEEMEDYARERGFPMIGPLVGQLCLLQARLIGAKRILELGSGFGYSAAWFTQLEGAQVTCTDGSQENVELAQAYLQRLGVWDRVSYHCGLAQELIQQEEFAGPWDLIFCDIDKQGYPEALALALPRLRVGGLLIFDNVIWGGYAWQPVPDDAPEFRQRMTPGVRKLNELVFANPDLLASIIPLRDGVAVIQKLR